MALLGASRSYGFDVRILREPVNRFITPQLSFHPIERTLLCQTSPNGLCGFTAVTGHMFELVLKLFLGHIDFFFGSDAVDDKLSFDVVASPFLLATTQADPVDVDGSWINALLCKGADNPLEANVHLMLDEGFGYRKVVKLDEFGDDLFALQVGLAMIALVLEAFADFLPEFLEGGGIADVFGKFVVDLGQSFLLDAKNIDGVIEFFASELGVGVVRRVFDSEVFVIAGIGTTKIFVEGLHGFFGTDMAEDAIGLQGIASAFGSAEEFDLDEIAVLGGAVFDGSEGGGALLHFGERVGDALVGYVHLGDFDFEGLVIAEGEFGEDFEGGAELERLALLKIELIDLWLGDGSELLLSDGFFDVFGDQGLKDLALNVVGKAPLDEGNGGFAGPKTGDPSDAGQFFSNLFGGFGNFLSGNFQVQFFAASGIRHIDSPLSGQRLLWPEFAANPSARQLRILSRTPRKFLELPCGNSAGDHNIKNYRGGGRRGQFRRLLEKGRRAEEYAVKAKSYKV
jgi:hypothetical protein